MNDRAATAATDGEALRIGHGIRDDRDQPLDPEEQPVDRRVSVPLPVTVGSAPGEGIRVPQRMRGGLTIETTAGEIVDLLAKECHLCDHWDTGRYRALRLAGKILPDEVDEQRKAVLEVATPAELTAFTGDDRLLDACFGVCRALSHYSPDGILSTHARATCPAAAPGHGPIEAAFTPRRDARRETVTIRDRILQTAAGKGSP